MRLFFALPLKEDESVRLYDMRASLRQRLPRIRWIDPENFHITLAFLGDLSHNQFDDLEEVVESAPWNFSPLLLKTDGPGQFPAEGSPRVIYESVRGVSGPLEALQRRIVRDITPVVSLDKRRFRPHITLGRNPHRSGLSPGESGVRTLPVMEITLTKIVLYESHLRPSGAVYTPRAVIEAGGNP